MILLTVACEHSMIGVNDWREQGFSPTENLHRLRCEVVASDLSPIAFWPH